MNGRRLTTDELKSTHANVDFALDSMTEAARSVIPDRPWETPEAETWDVLSTARWIERLDISPFAKELVAAQLTANNGVPVKQQSQLGNMSQIRGGGLERYWTHSERFRCHGGNDQLAAKLAEKLGAEKIHLNPVAKKISIEGSTARVTTAAEKIIEADHVV